MYLRGQVVQQEAHPVLHVARVDDVVVVEHQHDTLGTPGPESRRGWSGVSRTDRGCSPASPAARADAPARKSAATAGYAHRHGRQAAGDDAAAAEDDMDRSHRPVQRRRVQSDQPRNYPLRGSTALCVNTAFAYPYYILPILFPHKKSLGLSPAIFGIMQSVMHGVIVSRIAGDKYSRGSWPRSSCTSLSASPTSGHSRLRKASPR